MKKVIYVVVALLAVSAAAVTRQMSLPSFDTVSDVGKVPYITASGIVAWGPGTFAPTGPASGDLSGNYPGPTVSKLQNASLPSAVANGFLKRNAANTGWEEVAYGTTSNTVAQGNDSRLPTQDENDALIGVGGTPSLLNRYVTEGDSRLNLTAQTVASAGTTSGTATPIDVSSWGSTPEIRVVRVTGSTVDQGVILPTGRAVGSRILFLDDGCSPGSGAKKIYAPSGNTFANGSAFMRLTCLGMTECAKISAPDWWTCAREFADVNTGGEPYTTLYAPDLRWIGNPVSQTFPLGSSIKIADNVGTALYFTEGANPYLQFVTSNGSEAVQHDVLATMKAGASVSGTLTLPSGTLQYTGPSGSNALVMPTGQGDAWSIKAADGTRFLRFDTRNTSTMEVVASGNVSLFNLGSVFETRTGVNTTLGSGGVTFPGNSTLKPNATGTWGITTTDGRALLSTSLSEPGSSMTITLPFGGASGGNVTVAGGNAMSTSADINGGSLTLSSGQSRGNGVGQVFIKALNPTGVTGATNARTPVTVAAFAQPAASCNTTTRLGAAQVGAAAAMCNDIAGDVYLRDGLYVQSTINANLGVTIASSRSLTLNEGSSITWASADGQMRMSGSRANGFSIEDAFDNEFTEWDTVSYITKQKVPLVMGFDALNNSSAPTGQTLRAGDNLTGGSSNTDGGTVFVRAGQSKGTGNSVIDFLVSPDGTSGTDLNAPVNAMRISNAGATALTAPTGVEVDIAGALVVAGSPSQSSSGTRGVVTIKGMLQGECCGGNTSFLAIKEGTTLRSQNGHSYIVFNPTSVSVTTATMNGTTTTGNIIFNGTVFQANSGFLRLSSTQTATGWYITNDFTGSHLIDFDLRTAENYAAIKGVGTSTAAPAGYVGEYIENCTALASAVSLTTATAVNIGSISLTPGDWDVSTTCGMTGSSTGTSFQCGVNTTTATMPASSLKGKSWVSTPIVSTADEDSTLTTPPVRVLSSATATHFGVARAVFSTGSPSAFGCITARRAR